MNNMDNKDIMLLFTVLGVISDTLIGITEDEKAKHALMLAANSCKCASSKFLELSKEENNEQNRLH